MFDDDYAMMQVNRESEARRAKKQPSFDDGMLRHRIERSYGKLFDRFRKIFEKFIEEKTDRP